jgi:hypothetical protein
MSLMQKATATRGPESLRDLQKEWAQTCMKFSQSQTRATMGFVEQFGQQVLGTIASNPFTPAMSAASVPAAAEPVVKTPDGPKTSAVTEKTATPKKPAAPKKPEAKKPATLKASAAKAAPKTVTKTSAKAPRKNSTNAEKS